MNVPVKGKIEPMKEGEESVMLCSASCLWERRPEITFRKGTPILFYSFEVLRSPLAGPWLWAAARWMGGDTSRSFPPLGILEAKRKKK